MIGLKMIVIILFFLSVTQAEMEEPDEQVEQVSSFLLDLIEKYDESGSGAISIHKYPSFLSEVLVQGHMAISESNNISEEMKDLLMNATSTFVKKYNTTEVGVQDFYFDLIKDFTTFLIENQNRYSPILDTFFGDTPFPSEKSQPQEPVQGQTKESIEL